MGCHRILVHGAGRMALAIANMLATDPRFEIVLVGGPEPDPHHPGPAPYPAVRRGGHSLQAMSDAELSGLSAIIMAGNVWAGTADIARIARRVGCHYLDISENPEACAEIAMLAQGAAAGFAPGCGLAPGYVTALAADAMRRAGPGARVAVHVGVLPARRINRLGYGNLLGVDGLMVEYFSPCLAIRQGRQVTLPPLSEVESVTLAGDTFESFTTAGSLDALVRAPGVAVESLVFKTLRYPGHLDYMRFLIDDLGLAERRHQLRSLLMNGLPVIHEDRVLIAYDVQCEDGERTWFEQIIDARPGPGDTWCSAGITATAAHVCAMVDLLCHDVLAQRGFISPGEVSPGELSRSPFSAPLLHPVANGIAHG